MKKYKFLFKPLFFIFSLLFTSWMVLAIEKLHPSDFGKYKSLFKTAPDTISIMPGGSQIKKAEMKQNYKHYLKNICLDYKAGLTDSIRLDQQLELFLENLPK